MNARLLTNVIISGSIFLSIGCSTLDESHPKLDDQKCDVCHQFPPNDSAAELDTLEATIGVHAKFSHQDYVKPDSPDCGVCHHTFNTVSRSWNIPENHWDGSMKLTMNSVYKDTMNTCYRCHRYSDCNTCHFSPPQNTHPLKDNLHKVHVTDEDFGCYVCHKGNNHKTKTIPPYGGTHDNSNLDVEFDILVKNGTVKPPMNALKPPTFDNISGTCQNIYCHGNTIAGGKASVAIDAVIPPTGAGRCNACHETTALLAQVPLHAKKGSPQKPGHAENFKDCQNCHLNYSIEYYLVTDSLHINGAVDLTGCEKCHTDKIPSPFALVNGKIVKIQ